MTATQHFLQLHLYMYNYNYMIHDSPNFNHRDLIFLFHIIHTVHIPILIASANLCTESNTFMSCFKTPTCFGTEVP
jgi:hypothetical protein